jgi:D-alanyl-D-alanine carboxypeptidase
VAVALALAGVVVAGGAAGGAEAATGGRPVSELVLDARSGDALFARGETIARAPASLTKMMTLFLVFDALDAGSLRLSDTITVSRHAAGQQPSRLGLRPGQTLPVKTAIRAVAVDSANDVAVALAERLGGSEPAFARLMTRRARQLGLRHTSFANATGLTNSGNRTTAQDIGLLSLALLHQHANRYSLFGTRSIRWGNRTLANHNHLIGHVPGVDGIKTGYTVDAGFNLAASAKRKGRRVIVVVLGERSASARDVRVSNLLEKGFITRPRAAAS